MRLQQGGDHLTIGEFGPILIVYRRNRVVQNTINIGANSFKKIFADKIDLAQ